MPPSVTYWTGIWEPHREALSSQVQALRQALAPTSIVISFSAGQRSSIHYASRLIRLSAQRDLTLRVLAAVLEPTAEITHAFGSLDGWHFLRNLGRRPLVYTVALPGRPLYPSLYERAAHFVAETAGLASKLAQAGVSARRITLIPPGVDLTRFVPLAFPDGRFRLVFASTPSDRAEFEPRGIPLLIEAARLRPDIDLVFLWRPWGNLARALELIASYSPPDNVKIEQGDIVDMAAAYGASHAVACCFERDFGKSAPNSVIEALACGRPALVTDTCDLAGEIATRSAGVVTARTAKAVAAGIDRLQSDHGALARQARSMAEALFDRNAAHAAYDALYATVRTPGTS